MTAGTAVTAGAVTASGTAVASGAVMASGTAVAAGAAVMVMMVTGIVIIRFTHKYVFTFSYVLLRI